MHEPGGKPGTDPGRRQGGCLFSATLLPVSYYRKLLSVRTDDYAVYVESPFDKQRRLILAATDVSSLYKRRNAAEYTTFARYLLAMVCGRKGRYLAFFPLL